MLKKKKATGSIGYMLLFGLFIVMVITSMYLVAVAKLMTHQHEIDDALADSVLASMVCDDTYYFSTLEGGNGILRYKNKDKSYQLYKEAMSAAVSGRSEFYYNFSYTTFILYEVSGNSIQITTFTPSGKVVGSGTVGTVKTPGGKVVSKTSAYAKVNFDIKSILDGSLLSKARDIYCEMEIN